MASVKFDEFKRKWIVNNFDNCSKLKVFNRQVNDHGQDNKGCCKDYLNITHT